VETFTQRCKEIVPRWPKYTVKSCGKMQKQIEILQGVQEQLSRRKTEVKNEGQGGI